LIMTLKNTLISFYKKHKKTIFLVLRIVIGLTLIGVLIGTQLRDFGNALEILKSSHIGFLILAFSTHFAGLWITAERWRILLKAQGVRLGVGTLSVTVLISFLYSNVLPTTIGGDVYRIYDSAKKGDMPAEKAASVVLVERFSGVVSGASYAVIALFLGFTAIGEQSVIIPIVIFFTFSLVIGFLIINPSILKLDRLVARISFLNKIRKRLKNIYNTLRSFKQAKLSLFLALILSFAMQFMIILEYYLAAKALDIDLGLVAFVFISPVVAIITMLPISIGGLGLRENALVFILVAMGVANERAAVFSLLILVMFLALGILGGLANIIRPFFERKEIAAKEKRGAGKENGEIGPSGTGR